MWYFDTANCICSFDYNFFGKEWGQIFETFKPKHRRPKLCPALMKCDPCPTLIKIYRKDTKEWINSDRSLMYVPSIDDRIKFYQEEEERKRIEKMLHDKYYHKAETIVDNWSGGFIPDGYIEDVFRLLIEQGENGLDITSKLEELEKKCIIASRDVAHSSGVKSGRKQRDDEIEEERKRAEQERLNRRPSFGNKVNHFFRDLFHIDHSYMDDRGVVHERKYNVHGTADFETNQ